MWRNAMKVAAVAALAVGVAVSAYAGEVEVAESEHGTQVTITPFERTTRVTLWDLAVGGELRSLGDSGDVVQVAEAGIATVVYDGPIAPPGTHMLIVEYETESGSVYTSTLDIVVDEVGIAYPQVDLAQLMMTSGPTCPQPSFSSEGVAGYAYGVDDYRQGCGVCYCASQEVSEQVFIQGEGIAKCKLYDVVELIGQRERETDIERGEPVTFSQASPLKADAVSCGTLVLDDASAGQSGACRCSIWVRPAFEYLEGFEDGRMICKPWKLDSCHPWIAQTDVVYGGQWSACSGSVGNNGSSVLAIAFAIDRPAQLQFAYRVESEEYCDFLSFSAYLSTPGVEDPVQVISDRWSGSVPWTTAAYSFRSAGTYVFIWEYTKDESDLGITRGDRAYLDDVHLTALQGGEG